MREALFSDLAEPGLHPIWRGHRQDMSLANWSPPPACACIYAKIRGPVVELRFCTGCRRPSADPYEGKQVILCARINLGFPEQQPGQFQRPRDLAFAPDGSFMSPIPITTASSILQRWYAAAELGDFCRSRRKAGAGRHLQRALGYRDWAGWIGLCRRYLEPPHPEIHCGR